MKENTLCEIISFPRRLNKTSFIKVLSVTSILIFTGCASTNIAPDQALQAAENAIDNANQERVTDYALPELVEARSKLTAARFALLEKNMVLAKSLAEESRVSAELASAKAEQIKSNKINQDMIKSIETLKQEMQRSSGETQ